MQIQLSNLDSRKKRLLSQCVNYDIGKVYVLNTPLLIKDVPNEIDAFVLSECWKYFKRMNTNLPKEKLHSSTIKRIKSDVSDVVIKFYKTYLEGLFINFVDVINACLDDIKRDTSVVLRLSVSKMGSDEFIVCVIPDGQWWVLHLPTDKAKMLDWLETLVEGKYFGRCMQVNIYKVLHPSYVLTDKKV